MEISPTCEIRIHCLPCSRHTRSTAPLMATRTVKLTARAVAHAPSPAVGSTIHVATPAGPPPHPSTLMLGLAWVLAHTSQALLTKGRQACHVRHAPTATTRNDRRPGTKHSRQTPLPPRHQAHRTRAHTLYQRQGFNGGWHQKRQALSAQRQACAARSRRSEASARPAQRCWWLPAWLR